MLKGNASAFIHEISKCAHQKMHCQIVEVKIGCNTSMNLSQRAQSNDKGDQIFKIIHNLSQDKNTNLVQMYIHIDNH